jgi:hypothetical protein
MDLGARNTAEVMGAIWLLTVHGKAKVPTLLEAMQAIKDMSDDELRRGLAQSRDIDGEPPR